MKTAHGLSILLAFACTLLFIHPARASHVMGTDLSYVKLGGDSFLVKIAVYRDCNGITVSATNIKYWSSCSTTTLSAATSVSNSYDITPVCPSTTDRCQNGSSSFAYGMSLCFLTSKIVLDTGCCQYYVSWEQCCRTSSITTGAAGQDFYTEMYINRCARPGNSSPEFGLAPPLLILKDACYTLSPGIRTPYAKKGDDDSLVFKLEEPLSAHNSPIAYASGYSYREPVIYKGYPKADLDFGSQCLGFHLDHATGLLSFKPVQTDITVIVISVEQWGKDKSGKMTLLGKVRRDIMTCVTDLQTDAAPALSRTDATSDSIFLMAWRQSCLEVGCKDMDTGNKVTLTLVDPLLSNDTFAVSTTGKYDKAKYCWKPDAAYCRKAPYLLTISAKDNACPIELSNQHVYRLFVDSLCIPGFSMKDTICLNDTLKITNQTDYYSKKPSYTWYFGDGDTSHRENPAHHYKKAGAYTVKLVAQEGSKSRRLSKKVTVQPSLAASISLSNVGYCAGSGKYIFTAKVQNAIAKPSYEWSFGNGKTSSKAIDTVIYAKKGKYPISLKVEDSLNCSPVVEVHDTIKVGKETYFDFNSDSIQCVYGNLFKFYHVPGAKTYTWDFGDGKFATGIANPTHSYKDSGSYKVMVTVQDSLNCYDSFYRFARVERNKASFKADTNAACAGHTFHFTNTSHNNAAAQYFWYFDGQDMVQSRDAQYSFKTKGTHRVQLTARYLNNCDDYFVLTLIVQDVDASFSADTGSACAGHLFKFSAIGKNDTSTRYTWLMDGKDQFQTKDVSYTFSGAGSHQVQLITRNALGCEDTVKKSITIFALPKASFSGPDTIYTKDTAVYQAALQTGASYHWKVIGRNPLWVDSSTAGSISLRFDTIGAASLSLNESSEYGCTDSSKKQIVIRKRPGSGIESQQPWHTLSIYPSPAHNSLRLDMYAGKAQKVNLRIYDLKGALMQLQELPLLAGRQTKEIDFSRLPSGIYLLQLQSDIGIEYLKLVIE